MKIELRMWNDQDQQALMELCNQVDRRYLSNRIPESYTLKDAKWYIDMARKAEGSMAVFRAIFVDNVLVGNISVERKEDVFCKDGEIGYILLQEYWSKGIMSEAVKQICKIAFETLDLIRITGYVFEKNIASKKVLEKNDFALEGIMKLAVCKEEDVDNLCIYGKYR